MADNVESNPGTGGAIFATDEDGGGAQHPYTKLEWGPNDTFTKVNTGSDALPIQDGGNSLTVDQPTASSLNAQVVGNAASGASDSGNPVKAGGKYNSTLPTLTDGQRGDLQQDPSGNLRVKLAGHDATGADGTSNTLTFLLGAATQTLHRLLGIAMYMFNGSTWDRVRGDTTNGLDVDVTRLPALAAGTENIGDVDVASIAAGDNNIGNVDIVSLPAIPAGNNNIGDVDIASIAAGDNNIGNVDIVTLPAIPAGNNNIGDVDVASIAAGDNNIGNVDIVSGPTGASALQVQGTVAHDSAVAQNPVQIGVRANANEPTPVSDGDVTHVWADTFGRLITVSGHPSPETPASVNATSSGNTTVISAPGAGSLYICKVSVHNRDASNVVVALTDGAGGTTCWRAELKAEGGGSLIDFGSRGWKLSATTALVVNLGGASSVDVNVTEYYIAA